MMARPKQSAIAQNFFSDKCEARKENMFGLYEVQNVCLQRVIQDAYESNFGCQKFCQKSEKVK